MISFILHNISAIGSAQVLENGDTIQSCILEIKINGIVNDKQIINNNVEFIIPNSIMVGSSTPTLAGWEYIKNFLAPQWISLNYAESI
jgi:hypothetical protein